MRSGSLPETAACRIPLFLSVAVLTHRINPHPQPLIQFLKAMLGDLHFLISFEFQSTF